MSLILNSYGGFGAPSVANVSATITNTDSPISGSTLTTYTFSSASLGEPAFDRLIAILIATYTSAADTTVSTATIGGVSATMRVRNKGGSNHTYELWTAKVPSGTTGNIVVTFTGSCFRCGVGVFRIVGAATEAPYHSNYAAASSLTVSTSVNVPANGCLLGGSGGSRNASTFTHTFAGVTEKYDETVSGGTCHGGGCDNVTTKEDGRTVSATYSALPEAPVAGVIAASWGPYPEPAVTWNSADKGSLIVLSNGNLRAAKTGSSWESVRATLGRSSGKRYFELNCVTSSGNWTGGLGSGSMSLSNYVGATSSSASAPNGGNYVTGWTKAQTGTFTFSAGSILQYAVDFTSGFMWVGLNGSWQLSGNPSANSTPWVTGITGTCYPAFGTFDASRIADIQANRLQFDYTPPTGFIGWAEE